MSVFTENTTKNNNADNQQWQDKNTHTGVQNMPVYLDLFDLFLLIPLGLMEKPVLGYIANKERAQNL